MQAEENRETVPHVTILLAVYNGAEMLEAQMQSYLDQAHTRWNVLASDDGSTDESRPVLATWAARDARFTLLDGPRQGGAQNFLFLLREAALRGPVDGWIAFSDQDDVWLPDRLSGGIAALISHDPDVPALYCSRYWITDARLQSRRLSTLWARPPSFRNALVQNIATGHTILLNPAATRLISAAASEAKDVVVHDWWVYQLITGAGGTVVHDPEPKVLYRQHSNNQIGINDAFAARMKRIWQLLRGDFRSWNAINIAALRASEHRLADENRALLEAFSEMRNQPLPARLWSLRALRLYRQTSLAQGALWLAALLGRL